MTPPTDEELLAFAEELLATEQATAVELQLRNSPPLRARLAELLELQDQGQVSLGEVWRHNRLSCPEQSELGLFLVGALDAVQADYIRFHLETVGCVFCQAQRDEMQSALTQPTERIHADDRRDSLYASSAGWLPKSREKQ